MNVLLTGGLGFIGSHTAVELINAGHHVVIYDNLCNAEIGVLTRIEKLLVCALYCLSKIFATKPHYRWRSSSTKLT